MEKKILQGRGNLQRVERGLKQKMRTPDGWGDLSVEHVEGLLKDFKKKIKEKENLKHKDPRALSEEDEDENIRIENGYYEITRQYAEMFFAAFGISFQKTTCALAGSAPSVVRSSFPLKYVLPSMEHLAANVEAMVVLEKRTPGAVKFLYSERGVRNFARYTTSFWEKQFQERHVEGPYVLVINPVSLEKDAATETRVYNDFQKKLRKLDQPHILRVIEIADIPDLFRMLLKLHKRKGGSENKVKAAIYDGHGLSHRLFLSEYPFKRFGVDEINHPDFEEIFSRHLSGMFTSDAQFIFASCEAAYNTSIFGDGDSVAHALKRALTAVMGAHVRVAASEHSLTPFSSLGVKLEKNGAISINCTFSPQDEDDDYEDEDDDYDLMRLRNL